MTSAPVRSDMEVMGQNKILGEGWTLLAEVGEGGRHGWMGASSSTMAVIAKTIADIHESSDRNTAKSLLFNTQVLPTWLIPHTHTHTHALNLNLKYITLQN